MNNKSASPLALDLQQMSSQIYDGNDASQLDTWRCSSRIPKDIALSIYQRNLHVGIAQHLQTHFPVMYAYMGERAFEFICAEYLKASPPEQSIFTIYAAHFPGFLLEYGEQNSEQLIWSVSAPLAQMDFFHQNTFCEDQRMVVEARFYQLWIDTKLAIESDAGLDSDGLYRQLELHPEHCLKLESKQITLVTFWDDGELFFRVE
jgi:hypothetical protein